MFDILWPNKVCPVVLEKKFFNFINAFSLFRNYLPWTRYFNKLGSLPTKDVLCQFWMKLAQWFLRRRWKCEKFSDRQMDRRTARQQAIRKAHLSFQISWAKNQNKDPKPNGKWGLYRLLFVLYWWGNSQRDCWTFLPLGLSSWSSWIHQVVHIGTYSITYHTQGYLQHIVLFKLLLVETQGKYTNLQ